MDEISDLLIKSSKNLSDLRRLVTQFNNEINELRSKIRNLRSESSRERVPVGLTDKVIKLTREGAPNILREQALAAIEKTKEFNTGYFISDINEAIGKPETYKITTTGIGTRVDVRIALDDTAGTLAGYGLAIRQARRSFSMKLDPARASYFWEVYLYATAREGNIIRVTKKKKGSKKGEEEYEEVDVTQKYIDMYNSTINLRRGYFHKSAPWWKIVDMGNRGLELSSNRDGMAYPNYDGTFFVERSEKLIEGLYYEYLSDAIDQYHESINEDIEKAEDELRTAKIKFNELVSADYSNPEVAKAIVMEHINMFYENYRVESITDDMLDRAVENILLGRISTSGRVALGGAIPRIRTIEILREFDRLISDTINNL